MLLNSAELRIVVEKLDIKSVAGSIRLVDATIEALENGKKRSAAELLAAFAVQRILRKSKLSQTPGEQGITLNYLEMQGELNSVQQLGSYDLDHFERTVKDMLSSVGSTGSVSYYDHDDHANGGYVCNCVKNLWFTIKTSVD